MLLVLFHEPKELKSNINKEFKPRGVAARGSNPLFHSDKKEFIGVPDPSQLSLQTISVRS